MMAGRFRTGVATYAVAVLREPLHVAMLLVLPPLVVLGFGEAMASMPAFAMEAAPRTVGTIRGALFSTAFLSGVLGLYQSLQPRAADRRLVLTGYPRGTILAARLAVIAGFVSGVAAVSYGVMTTVVAPAAPLRSFAVLLAGGGIYAVLGVLVGALVTRRLDGTLVVVLTANMDAFVATGPSSLAVGVRKLLPLYFPIRLLKSAVLDGVLVRDEVVGAAAYGSVLLVVAFAFFVRTVRTEGTS